MSHFLIKIGLRYLRYSAGLWILLIVMDVLLEKVAGDGNYVFSVTFGFLGANFLSAILMNTTRWPVFWRRTSGSIFKFWAGIGSVLFFNLISNLFFHLVISEVIPVKEEVLKLFAISMADKVWATVLVYLFCVASIFDSKAHLMQTTLKPLKQFTVFFIVYGYLIGLMAAMAYSRLLAYAFGSILLFGYICFQNNLVLHSIQKKIRFQLMALGLVATVVCAFFSYQVEISKASGSSNLLGRLGPQKKWNYSDIEKIERPIDWVNWWTEGIYSNYNFSNEETVNALSKLELLCPIRTTDRLSEIECLEDGDDLYSKYAVVYGVQDENSILGQLDSPVMYVRLLGVLSARTLKVMSDQLEKKLLKISKEPGRLGPVAENTLARHGKGRAGIKVVLKQK